MSSHKNNHDYHLVDPSPLPLMASMALFFVALGAVTSMHNQWWADGGPYSAWAAATLFFGIGFLIYVLVCWWKDVFSEGDNGCHTEVVRLHFRYGIILFIMSEIMFFVSWFWAYFDVALTANDLAQYARVEATGGFWPPKGVETFYPFSLPFINTLILLTSGTTVTWAHHALLEEDKKGVLFGLLLTIFLGVTFTMVQAFEYSHATFGFKESLYGSVFFMATGFHGAHVILGTIFLIIVFFRASKNKYTKKSHFSFEAAAWYWHFVDVVWLFLFLFVYIWGFNWSG